MASLQASSLLSSSSSCSCSTSKGINAALSVPKFPRSIRFSILKRPARDLVEELSLRSDGLPEGISIESQVVTEMTRDGHGLIQKTANADMVTAQLYAILEAVADRVEMHKNIGKQRDNWNTLLLNSLNMITLTAATMAGVAAAAAGGAGGAEVPLLALKLSSGLLFSAATGMLFIMNKIQPSQLAEEQRNATRLFRQLYNQIQTTLALRDPTESDVKDAMDKVLALDRAYPLPLLGKMIEKFPAKFRPAVWWPKSSAEGLQRKSKSSNHQSIKGWNKELEMEMRELIDVLKRKDAEDYMRLGNMALNINKILAISGPLLTGIAAASSTFVGNGSWAAIVAVTAGALSTIVNTFEHGGQVGMVVEMYRNCAGFLTFMQEHIDSTVEEGDMQKRENGQVFELKVALQLGRSLSEVREFAKKSSSSRLEGISIGEFASKLI